LLTSGGVEAAIPGDEFLGCEVELNVDIGTVAEVEAASSPWQHLAVKTAWAFFDQNTAAWQMLEV